MIVICEECGKKYRIDPTRIKGKRAKFKCKSCGHIVAVIRPEGEGPEETIEMSRDSLMGTKSLVEKKAPETHEPASEQASPGAPATTPTSPEPIQEDQKPKKKPKPAPTKSGRMGLRLKMILLFFLIPLVLMTAAGALYLRQLDALSRLITTESSKMVSQFAERAIEESAGSVAAQIQLYLESHGNYKKEKLDSNSDFKKVAVQKVGKTGYTAFYELPGKDGIWRTWAHPNSKIIGIDMSRLQKPLGRNFPGFWRVYTGVQSGKESKGYYTWQDKDGTFRDKFMVCTPVKGTPFIVAATTYMDEFTEDVKRLEGRANRLTEDTKRIVFVILGGALILVVFVVSLYGHILTGRIKSLTAMAERISVGDLDAEISIRSKDELGSLAEAIGRMQESIRISIERLRKRR
jgi:predicted Zn finger-like uncharacterized protein